MSSFKEIQEKFKESVEKKNKALASPIPIIYLAPIKFELINNEYHIFLMMETGAINILANGLYHPTEENIKNIIKQKLNIILPFKESNIVKLTKIGDSLVYVFDGSKLNIDMINYLSKLDGHKNNEYQWYDINQDIKSRGDCIALELKEILIDEIANGRIFE